MRIVAIPDGRRNKAMSAEFLTLITDLSPEPGIFIRRLYCLLKSSQLKREIFFAHTTSIIKNIYLHIKNKRKTLINNYFQLIFTRPSPTPSTHQPHATHPPTHDYTHAYAHAVFVSDSLCLCVSDSLSLCLSLSVSKSFPFGVYFPLPE